MKHKYFISFFTAVACVLIFSSCTSSKSMLREIEHQRADLYYVTTTPPYLEEVNKDVYLNFIDYSNMDYYTSIKKKGYALVPLFFYNYCYERFEARLGERSLTMNYREFLTDALLAECNTSTCFNLIDNSDSIACDSAYILDIKIARNITKAKMTIRYHAIFTGYLDLLLGSEDGEEILPPVAVINRNRTHPAVTELKVKAILRRNGEVLIEKDFQLNRSYQFTRKGSLDTYLLNSTCLDAMAESLAMATKDLVEEMSRELHLVMLSYE